MGANTTDYMLDQSMFVRELLNGTVKATYLVGPRGPEYRRDDQAGTIRWYVYDGLGSVVGEVAPDGTLTRSQSFDVYGCVRTSSGTATTKHKFVGSLGHPSDDETGLIYMRARHYDPVCGRFVSQDPSHNGSNWFAYCDGDPTNKIDRDGRSPERWAEFNALLAAWTAALEESEAFRIHAEGALRSFDMLTAMLDAFQGSSGRMSEERRAYDALEGAYETATAEPAEETIATYVSGEFKGYAATLGLWEWFLDFHDR